MDCEGQNCLANSPVQNRAKKLGPTLYSRENVDGFLIETDPTSTNCYWANYLDTGLLMSATNRQNEFSINSRIMLPVKGKDSPPPQQMPCNAGSLDLAFMINDFLPGCTSLRPRNGRTNPKQARRESESANPAPEAIDMAKVKEEIAAKRMKLIEALRTPDKPVVQAAAKTKDSGKVTTKKNPPPTVAETRKHKTPKQSAPTPPAPKEAPITTVPPPVRANANTHNANVNVMPDSFPVNNPKKAGSSVHGRKTVTIREQQEIQMARRKEVIARLKEEKVKKASTPNPKKPVPAAGDTTNNKSSSRQRPAVAVGGFRSTARIGFMYENDDTDESV
uniref:WH1 domain-containing protein n=1 Tax=Panagrellus redivivus TaxID=6233 RepID=A0A7E4VW69_PANRE